MDPRRLLTFRSVSHERSFSGAARALNLSQPSVLQQIALLETETGVRLFDRGRGGLRLTPEGELLLTHADHIAWRLELATQQIAEASRDRRHELRIGAFPTALASFVPEVMARLKAQDPDLKVITREVTPSTFDERLLRGEFDIAVGYQDASTKRRQFGDARRIELTRETFVIAMPTTHRLARGTSPVALEQFADDDWVVPSTDGFLFRAIRDAGFEPRVVSVSQSATGIIARGLAVGLVPSLLRSPQLDLVTRPLRDELPCRDIFAVIPPGELHPMAESALDVMREAAIALAG